MKKALFTIFGLLAIFSLSAQPASTVKDIDGNEYPTVVIGEQEWMAENLKTTRFNDGTSIPLVTDELKWNRTFSPAYTWYNNDKDQYKDAYGALYNWYAVNTEKLCPQGWHVPTEAEWSILTDYLGGKTIAGGKMKIITKERKKTEQATAYKAEDEDDILKELDQKTGKAVEKEKSTQETNQDRKSGPAIPGNQSLTGWDSPNTGATNESGFSALPGGERLYYEENISFTNMGAHGFWWTATESSPGVAWVRLVYFNNSHISRLDRSKRDGFNVRCLRD